MKKVITLILKGGDSKKFELDLAIGKGQDPFIIANRLLDFKNKNLLEGEEEIQLVKIKETDKVCYSHDWRVKGDHYMCRDCKIPGQRENPFAKIMPTFEDPMYKDCRWKIKI